MHIQTIDLHFRGLPHAIASYLVEGPDGPVLVETGPSSTLPALIAGLAEHGYQPTDIRDVLLTHIHLDHAGAAGWWAQQGARIHVHPRGAPHLADPTRLLSSATQIYGDQMEMLWGAVLPVPAERIRVAGDGEPLYAGGLTFTALDTPGHARHHHTYLLEDVAFTGDMAGVRLPGNDLVTVPTPPPEFDLEAWRGSIDHLAAVGVSTLYPTHFGALEGVEEHLDMLDGLVSQAAELVRRGLQAGQDYDTLLARFQAWNRDRAEAHGAGKGGADPLTAVNPQRMSLDGLISYWHKRSGG